jgi:hypothetical protein
MMIPLPGASTFGQVTRAALLSAAEALGLTPRIGERELHRMTEALPHALAGLVQAIEKDNAHYPEPVRTQLGGELRLLRTVQHVVVPEMLARVAS